MTRHRTVGCKGGALGSTLLALGLLLAGCAGAPREPFTPQEAATASPPGLQDVAYRNDDPAYTRMLQQTFRAGPDGNLNALAISGGGANGAYGAGLLAGWTRAGDRPQFSVVTGISTGALMAPFAFLGTTWDETMRQAYTSEAAQHVLQSRGLLALVSSGLYRRAPLYRLVKRYVTPELLAAVAAERRKGRVLLVATTDLDDDKLVVWDMGRIAEQDGPEARRLFVDILVASASIPGVFAPTMIRMQSGGHVFEELHVDGGVESAFFAIPQSLLLQGAPTPPPWNVRLFILINEDVASDPKLTSTNTLPILKRSIRVAGRAALRSLLISTYEYSKTPRHELHIASLPQTSMDAPLDFSGPRLAGLYAAGEQAAEQGRAWRSEP